MVVGTAVASAEGHVIWWRAVAALVVAVALQVGTNYANDYSDGVRGTDDVRVGPVRLVASGLASPAAVRRAALVAFGVAAVGGLALAAAAGWWLIAVGAACIAAGWLYTGGPRPYGYAGLGELFVFVFFGLVATVGTAYVQLGADHRPGGGCRRSGRAAGGGPARGQQPPGHSRRHGERQAHPGGADRCPGHPGAVCRHRAGAVRGGRRAGGVAALDARRLAGPAPGRSAGPPGPGRGRRAET